MKLKYWVRNRNTKKLHTHVELDIPDETVIEALKEHLAAPINCNMHTDFEYHNICIDRDY